MKQAELSNWTKFQSMSDPIPDTSENILKAVFVGLPKKQWSCLKDQKFERP